MQRKRPKVRRTRSDALLDQGDKPGVRARMQTAFSASPERLGEVARNQARRDTRAATGVGPRPKRPESKLFSLIAQRLAARVTGRGTVTAMLNDLVMGTKPGSERSLLCGATSSEIAAARSKLLRELVAAVRDVTEQYSGSEKSALERLGRAISACVERGTPASSEFSDVSKCIGLLKSSGASDTDFEAASSSRV
jgi:hypothetical protein